MYYFSTEKVTKMKIIFHENQLSYRGTSAALFDYAKYNEEYLGNESVILYNKLNPNNFENAVLKFKNRFEVIGYEDITQINSIVEKTKSDIFYAIKYGNNDGVFTQSCKSCIHTVFKCYEPHGDVYAYVSEWLSNEMSHGKSPYVPHMISLPQVTDDLRAELNIPKNAIVFGRHGGAETFDIKFVKKTVAKISRNRKDLYFIFLGTNPFVKKNIFRPYKNVIFLPATVDEIYKTKFINTCDAYLHARQQGESFGIAIGEFSIKNKPIITFKNSDEKSHLDILGKKALLYEDTNSLYNLLNTFTPKPELDWDCYTKEFSPTAVMDKFKKVFIDS
jgi:hypothetical protein